MTNLILSVAMLTSLALVIGAMVLLRRGQRKQPALMLVLAAVMVANVVIWSIPTNDGQSLLTAEGLR
ncbi:hypothetical protein [Blastomonas sp.]|uniref:hypothetical protein n=1 Tax=Blastomonas sp. TaxID=1909299 RepID=UPI0035945DFA